MIKYCIKTFFNYNTTKHKWKWIINDFNTLYWPFLFSFLKTNLCKLFYYEIQKPKKNKKQNHGDKPYCYNLFDGVQSLTREKPKKNHEDNNRKDLKGEGLPCSSRWRQHWKEKLETRGVGANDREDGLVENESR